MQQICGFEPSEGWKVSPVGVGTNQNRLSSPIKTIPILALFEVLFLLDSGLCDKYGKRQIEPDNVPAKFKQHPF